MGVGESKSLTGAGIKIISQYLIINLLLIAALLLLSVGLYINYGNLIEFSNSSPTFVAIVIFLFIIIYFWLIKGLVDIFNGRKEFGKKHETSVVFGVILIITYFMVFLITLSYSKGFAAGTVLIASFSSGFSSDFIIQFIITISLSAAAHLLFGLSLLCFIIDLVSKEQRKKIWIAFSLLVLSTFTLSITGIIALILFFKSYRETYYMLEEGKLKAAETAPCPFCNRDIPIDSINCLFCNKEFKKDASIELDPRLNFELPKSRFDGPNNYIPVEGPTEKEKNKLFYLIGIVIVVIIVIALISVLI
jgi:hypothetical protein